MSSILEKRNSFFNSLQVFRGIAAMMVVFHHHWGLFAHFSKFDHSLLVFLFSLGKNGVDFFFVLSGFIIAYSCYNKTATLENNRSYFLNRVLRIFLPYLPITIGLLLLYQLFPNMSGTERDISWLTSLTLIPDGTPALSVAWTLVHEMIFYTLFIIWFYTHRGWIIFTALWSGLIIYLNWFHGNMSWENNPFLMYFGSFYNLEFIIGFYLAYLVKRTNFVGHRLFLIPAAATFMFALFLKWHFGQENATVLVFALSFAFLIIGSVNSKLDRIKSSNILIILGNASYSIYLVHNPEKSFLMRLFPSYSGDAYAALVMLISIIICCLTGIIYSKIFEESLLKKAKSWLSINPVKPRHKELVNK